MPEPPAMPAESPPQADSASAKAPWVAVASVVLGGVGVLTSFVILPGAICGIAAIVLAHRAANQTGRDTGRPGRGLAITGRVLGIAALVICVVLSAVVLSGVLFVPRDQGVSKLQQAVQLRGIHMGLVVYANSNKEHMPGLDSMGHILADSEGTGFSGDGDTVQARYWILFDGDFIVPEYAIAPRDTDPLVTEYDPGFGEIAAPVRWDATVSHYSFAMLSIDGEPGNAPEADTRAEEWTQSLNAQAVVMSDRNLGTNATTAVQSNYASKAGEFLGSVLWNDNHVSFEKTHILETRYGSGPVYIDADGEPTDNIFLPQGDDDAYLIHRGD